MGLLDYLKQGQTALTNATGMDWNKIQADPGANAQALMGGQAMQYNQQPQSLIADTSQVNNQVNNVPTNVTPQQTQQVTYGSPVGPNMGQVNTETSEVSSYDDSNGYDPTKVAQPNANYNNRINAPMHPSLLMGAPEVYQEPEGTREVGYTTQVDNEVNTGVNSMTPVVAQTFPFEYPSKILEGGVNNPLTATDEEKEEFIRKRQEAMARLPWYLGGTGGK